MQRLDLGELPVFYEKGPGPAIASLTFRVGIADEQPAQRGITHLVEHLALFPLGQREYPYNGFVDLLHCTFFAQGTRDELEAFLADVASGLASLQLDRLDAEKRILTQESAAAGPDIVAQLLSHRFGMRAHGALDLKELGLRWLDPETVDEWRREWFTAGNAALWVHGPEPLDVDLGLPPGESRQPPPAEPLAGLEFPAWVAQGTGGVAIGAVAERTWGTTVMMGLAQERVFERLRRDEGLVYDVWGDYLPLGRDLSHVALGAACTDDQAARVADALITALEQLRDAGPSDDELATFKRRIERGRADDPDAVRRDLDRVTRETLLGRTVDPAEVLRLLGAVEASDVQAAAAGVLASAIVRVPDDCAAPREALASLDRPPAEFDAPRFKLKSLRQGASEIAVGEAGVRYSGNGGVVAIPAHEVAAVIEGTGGDFLVVAVDGSWVEIDPRTLRDGEAATEAIRGLSPAPLIPSDDERPGWVKQLAAEKLTSKWVVQSELALLPDLLDRDERPVTMAEARRGLRWGLLVVTSRRLMFLYDGLRKEEFLQFPRSDVKQIRSRRKLFDKVLCVAVGDDEFEFTDLKPREREAEIVNEFDRVAAGA
jgi:zinc protease